MKTHCTHCAYTLVDNECLRCAVNILSEVYPEDTGLEYVLECEHVERDRGICPDCGDEEDPGDAIDRAMDSFK